MCGFVFIFQKTYNPASPLMMVIWIDPKSSYHTFSMIGKWPKVDRSLIELQDSKGLFLWKQTFPRTSQQSTLIFSADINRSRKGKCFRSSTSLSMAEIDMMWSNRFHIFVDMEHIHRSKVQCKEEGHHRSGICRDDYPSPHRIACKEKADQRLWFCSILQCI